MRISDQITLADVSREYAEFIDKFKPKKTTDDCYTPDNVYEAILSWVCNEYGVDRGKVVRPFWPGADYLEMDYPEGCCVVDNPPFSIVSQICKNYLRAGIKFFLFCPHLTSIGICQEKITHITCGATITYENGADVNTGFVTNLDDEYVVRTAPDLAAAIADENRKNTRPDRVLPKYEYPVHVFTASMGGWLSKYGQDYRIRKGECFFIRKLDSQAGTGKSIFGSGFLLAEKAAAEKAAAEKAAAEKAAAEKAAAEKAAAEKWRLSERERNIIASLG